MAHLAVVVMLTEADHFFVELNVELFVSLLFHGL